MSIPLLADDHALAAGGALAVLILRFGGALRALGEAAARATAVELDAGAGAGDAVALAGAAGGDRGCGARGAVVGAAGAEGWDVGLVVGAVVLAVVLGVVEVCGGELGGEHLDGRVRELLGGDLTGLVGLDWHWAHDLGWGERAALGNTGGGNAARLARRLDWGGLAGLCGWDVEGVELAAGGGLSHGLAGWIVGDVVAVDDVVVPVALALLEGGSGEAEGTLPPTRLVGIL